LLKQSLSKEKLKKE
jgi:hypothetical protein